MEHAGCVLNILLQHQWVANHKKCEFGRTHIRYLGHLIYEKEMEMDQEKVKTVLGWEEPKTIKALRGFLGFTRYYRRYVRDYGKIVRSLTDMLKKGNFVWTDLARKEMDELKVAMTTAPMLALPDFTHNLFMLSATHLELELEQF